MAYWDSPRDYVIKLMKKEIQVREEVIEEFLGYIKEAKSFFKEITGKEIDGMPEIHFFLAEEGPLTFGFTWNNQIWLSSLLLRPEKVKKAREATYHEFFHFAVTQSKLENFAKSLSICRYIMSDDKIDYYPILNSIIEEAIAELFKTALANTGESGIFKKMFTPFLRELMEKIYNILRHLYSDSVDFVGKRHLLELLLQMGIGNPYDTGGIILLFFYEAYKKDGKADIKQFLRDVIFSPGKCEEKLSEEIKNDKNKKLLKSALSDALPEFNDSQEFIRYLRPAEKVGMFAEELKQKIRERVKSRNQN
jgi:hypothetical protein